MKRANEKKQADEALARLRLADLLIDSVRYEPHGDVRLTDREVDEILEKSDDPALTKLVSECRRSRKRTDARIAKLQQAKQTLLEALKLAKEAKPRRRKTGNKRK